MLMVGADSILRRDRISEGEGRVRLMTEAPTPVDPAQLKELGIEVAETEEE